jgi:hypothetical protein
MRASDPKIGEGLTRLAGLKAPFCGVERSAQSELDGRLNGRTADCRASCPAGEAVDNKTPNFIKSDFGHCHGHGHGYGHGRGHGHGHGHK